MSVETMDTQYVNIVDIYDDLLNIRSSYFGRMKFYNREMYNLSLAYSNFTMHDNTYFKRLCPLHSEKANINSAYKARINKYIEAIPSNYLFQEMIDEFVKDLV